MKSEQEGIENIRANKVVTPIFPSPKRRYTPSTLKPEIGSRFSSANSSVADADTPNKLKNQRPLMAQHCGNPTMLSLK